METTTARRAPPEPGRTPGGARRAGPARPSAGLWAVAAVLAAPVLAVRWPPLLDYPNHATRLWLLAGGASTPPLSGMYRVEWQHAATNVAVDAVAAGLARVLPAFTVAQLLLVAAMALPPLGAAALNRAALGGSHPWQAALGLLAFSTTLVAGFLSFQIGLGLALLAAAAEPALARRGHSPAALARALVAAVLLAVHAFAFLFYAALVGGLALGAQAATLRTGRGGARALGAAAVACAPLLVPLLLLVTLAAQLPGAHLPPGFHDPVPALTWREVLVGKAWLLASPLLTYRPRVDLLFAAALALPLVVGLLARRLRLHAGLTVAATALAVASVFMPDRLAGTYWIDRRLPTMALLAAAAAVRPELRVAARWPAPALAVALAAVCARTLWITGVWAASVPDVAAVERALAVVPAGAAVLPMEHRPTPGDLSEARRSRPGRWFLRGHPTYWHLATLAILERRAFVPTLFSAAGKQPIAVMPPWLEIAVEEGSLPSVAQLENLRARREYPYLAHWADRFDFVLVLNADLPDRGGGLPVRSELRLVADEGFARLYRIERAPVR